MKILVSALVAGLSIVAPAHAATIVDTGVPTSSNSGFTLGPVQDLASRFSLSAATAITDVAGSIGSISSRGAVTVAIRGGDALPGSVLYSGTFITAVSGVSFQGLSGLDWALAAGTYWISFASEDNLYMNSPAPSPLVGAYYSPSNGRWITDPSIQLGIRINGVAAAVPEPATWALMMVGFGAAGVAMRRRRARVAVRFA